MKKKTGHEPDILLMVTIIIITIFGLVMLSSASSDLGKMQFNDSYYYIKHQIVFGLFIGIIGFLFGYFIYYQNLKKIIFPGLLISIFFLALVFTKFGSLINNTNRWLKFGFISFQPAEFMKLTYVTYLSAWLSNVKIKREINFQEGFVPFFVISGIIAVLLLLQPATSTVIILLISGLIMYFISGTKLKYIVFIILVGILLFGAVIFVTPYRLSRIQGFLNQNQNVQAQNFQLNQSLIAIGSGGVWGVGYGQSATKASYLPAPIDDSIFAIIGEELGFVGASTVVILFIFLILRLFYLAFKMGDRFGKLYLIGFGSIIGLQAFVNMASISGIIPLTGVPFPFISYGGTALAVFLTMSGIALNITKYI